MTVATRRLTELAGDAVLSGGEVHCTGVLRLFATERGRLKAEWHVDACSRHVFVPARISGIVVVYGEGGMPAFSLRVDLDELPAAGRARQTRRAAVRITELSTEPVGGWQLTGVKLRFVDVQTNEFADVCRTIAGALVASSEAFRDAPAQLLLVA